MRAKELRIGNFVYTTRVEIVETISPYYVYTKTLDGEELTEYKNPSLYTPIPLTEQWILDLGWDKVDNKKTVIDTYTITNGLAVYWFTLTGGSLGIYQKAQKDIPAPTNENIRNTIDIEESMRNFAWGIKYVHQLQNLYYALTGEELTYNPK